MIERQEGIRAVPEGYGTVTPWIISRDTPKLIDFLVFTFDATEIARAVEAGGFVMTDVTEMAWGDRVGRIRDPLGNVWWIQERLAELTPEAIFHRFAEPEFVEAMQYVQNTLSV